MRRCGLGCVCVWGGGGGEQEVRSAAGPLVHAGGACGGWRPWGWAWACVCMSVCFFFGGGGGRVSGRPAMPEAARGFLPAADGAGPSVAEPGCDCGACCCCRRSTCRGVRRGHCHVLGEWAGGRLQLLPGRSPPPPAPAGGVAAKRACSIALPRAAVDAKPRQQARFQQARPTFGPRLPTRPLNPAFPPLHPPSATATSTDSRRRRQAHHMATGGT
jgi:hypothetical protein